MTTISIGKADADGVAAKLQELLGDDVTFPVRVTFENKRQKRPVLVNAGRTHAHLYGGEKATLQFRHREDLYNAVQDLTHFASVGNDEVIAHVTYGDVTPVATATATEATGEAATEAAETTESSAGAAEE